MIASQEIASGHGLLIRAGGTVNADEVSTEKRTIPVRFPHLASWYFVIADFSGVSTLNIDAPNFDLLVEVDLKLAKLLRSGLPVAVLARSELVFGIARMWQASSESTGWEIQVFRERAAAEAWIRHHVLAGFGVDLPPFDAAAESATTA